MEAVDKGEIKNIPAPEVAKKYWKLDANATLRDVIIATGLDECEHRDVNHQLSDLVKTGKKILKPSGHKIQTEILQDLQA
jgi:ubiquinol oxidase